MSGYFAYNLRGLLNLTAAIISLSVGLLVLSRGPRSRVHQSFFLINLTGSIWIFCYAMIFLVSTDDRAYLWLRLSYVFGVPFISPAVYLFAITWTNQNERMPIAKVGFGFAGILTLIMALFTHKICSFLPHSWGRLNIYLHNTPGTLFFVAVVSILIGYGTAAFWTIFRAWRQAEAGFQRTQYGYFLLSAIAGYLATFDFVAARQQHGDILYWGAFFFLSFVLIISYAIVRHQFLDVNLLLRRLSLIALIYALLIAVMIPAATAVFKHLLADPSRAPLPRLIAMSLASGAFLSLGPLIYAFSTRHFFWLKAHVTTGLTHELKSPVSAIMGAIDLMSDQIKKDAPENAGTLQYAEIIRSNGRRLEAFVKNLLHVAKIQDGIIQVNKEPIDLGLAIQSTAESYRSLVTQRSLTMLIESPSPMMMNGDAEKLQQVLSNLLSNALKFTTQGGIRISSLLRSGSVTVKVADTGTGISTSDIPHVFDRFFQGRHVSKGSGIGLTIAKAWVEAHGGKIWAESEGEGKGTTVTFTLPVA